MKRNLSLLTVLLLALLAALHAAEPRVFNIMAYGAKSDGQTINTSAIQRAIDACHTSGGGTVLVPSGVFVSGSLRLKSRVTLKIGKDAILRGSPKIADYAVETAELHWGGSWQYAASQWRQCLIYAEDAEQIGIEGPGTIDGQGGRERKVFPNANDTRRPMLVRLIGCRKVTVCDVKLLDPASFTTFFVRSQGIHIERVTIRSQNSPNGDGLDFNGCRRVRIKDCDLYTGDDGIAPKTFHPDWPNEDFEISGCRIRSRWHAIRIGAESIAAIRRLTMRDCVFTHCQGGIKIETCEGALFEDLSFSGIEMKQVCQPFMVLASRFPFSAHGKSARPPVGRIRNVRLTVEKPDARAFIAGDDIEGLTLQGVVARAPALVPGLAKLADAKDVNEKDCRVECGASVPVIVTPNAEELRRLAELRVRSAEFDRQIQKQADQADAAARKATGQE